MESNSAGCALGSSSVRKSSVKDCLHALRPSLRILMLTERQQKDPRSRISNKIYLVQSYKGARKTFGYKLIKRGTRLDFQQLM